MEPETLLASNTKTIISVDVPVVLTCKGRTPDCPRVCYAAVPGWFTAVPWVIPHQIETFRCIKRAPESAAERLIAEFHDRQQREERQKRRLRVLTWFGVGDGFPEAAAAINHISREAPHIIQWVRSRIPSFIALIAPSPSVFIMGSLDGTAHSLLTKKQLDDLDHPRLYYSFRRKRADEDCLGAQVIFNIKQLPGLPTDDPRVCLADAGQEQMEGACSRCERCFGEAVLQRPSKGSDRIVR
jgi:hypothetical protein